MTTPVPPIPPDHAGATPYLTIPAAGDALEFYTRAFGACVAERLAMPDGRIGHAEVTIGAARIMLADEFPEMGFRGPRALGGTPVSIHVYVEDVDALTRRALAAGAELERPVTDEFYGDRVARLVDPFGHRWLFATRKENVSSEEMHRRAAVLFGGAPEVS